MIRFPPFFLLTFLFSCDYFQPKEPENVVARVGKVFLYQNEIEQIQTDNLSKEDSTNLVNAYIGNWVRSQTILQQAQNQLSANEIDEIKEKVNDYEASLLQFQFESQYVAQHLDTIVGNQEIEDYLANHEQDFQLQEPVVRYIFVEKNQEFEDLQEVNRLFNQLIEEGNDYELQSYCLQMVQCRTDALAYASLSSMVETFGLESSSKVKLSVNRLHKLRTEKYEYLYQILEYKESGTAPVEYVSEDIRTIILRNRERQLIEQLRNGVYETAKNNNQIERFD